MASTYTPIATQTLGSSAASVTFSSISGSYTDLILVTSPKMTTGSGGIWMQFNGDTGSNYSYTNLYGNGSAAGSGRASGSTYIAFGNSDTTNFDIAIANIMNYSNTTTYKSLIARGAMPSAYTTAWAGLWRNTSAITSITLLLNSPSNFAAGSTFTLYGVKSA